jgi:hypothetical protein
MEEFEGLRIELKFRLYDDILMKSALWIELTETRQKQKDQLYQSEAVASNPNCRVVGSEDLGAAKPKLSDLEIIAQQILHHYDVVQF